MRLFVDLDGVLADFDSHYEKLFGTRPNRRLGNEGWAKIRRGFASTLEQGCAFIQCCRGKSTYTVSRAIY
jgi:hypothetical protein